MYTAINVIILFIVIAMLFPEGLWSNTIGLINVVFSALLATNYFEPLAGFLESNAKSFTYIWDFVALWLLFFLSYAILSTITQTISTHRVRFKMPLEMGGRFVMAALIAAVICGFFNMTMHTAPLGRNPVKGGFQKTPMANNVLGFAPDRMWLGFVQSRSRGALSVGDPAGTDGKREFDPNSEFVLKYGQRRKDLEDQMESTTKLRVGVR
jgi:hypothetical protein